MELEIRDDRQMRALTGVPMEKLEVLEAAFAKAYVEKRKRISIKNKSRMANVSENLAEDKKANCQRYEKS